ncbi:MAG TPA: paraquat-inducible protein A [Kofleriaceae bacterium]|jgi:paraquat-inducible protein A
MIRGVDLGITACKTCELVVRLGGESEGVCPRCEEPVRRRRPKAMQRAWAYLAAAALFYVPANMLVIMHTEQLPTRRDDTILSGIAHLWHSGSWDLAVLVFAASILVPVVKLASLGVLLVTTEQRSTWRQRARTKLYRVLEVIGHWSMLDVFVVALLTAVVQVGRFAKVEPGPALLPFAGVVILTMLASHSFDPRLIWDRAEKA